MKKITINLSFYNQDNILKKHVKGWTKWSKDILNYFSFCIVEESEIYQHKNVQQNG